MFTQDTSYLIFHSTSHILEAHVPIYVCDLNSIVVRNQSESVSSMRFFLVCPALKIAEHQVGLLDLFY